MSEARLVARAILSRLVSFASVSDRSNLDMADYIEAHLSNFGGRCLRFPSPDGRKTNLLATIGPMVAGGVVLSGHMDVVPVEGQGWSSNPFSLVERNGALFGRGATDMKGFIAVCLAVASVASVRPLRRPIHFAFSYDEEVGCVGVGPMIDYVAQRLPKPDCVIVGEPTGMQPVTAHKGANDWRTLVTGLAAHSGVPHLGAHAIFAGARLIGIVESIQDSYRAQPEPGSSYEAPYPTLSVGLAQGGRAGNIIPAEFTFDWEARTIRAGQAAEIIARFTAEAEIHVLPRLRATYPQASIDTEALFDVPPLVAEPGGAAERLSMMLRGVGRPGVVAYCSEGGLFQRAGLSTVICGPGSIAQAHQPDEFVTLDQLDECQAFLERLIDHLAA